MPRHWIWAVAILSCVVAGAANANSEKRAGVRSMTLSAPARGQAIELTVWYPTAADGPPEAIGENKIFKGTPGLRNAPIANGRHPIILLAHGGFRAAPFHEGWIAAYLATRGYIVGVTHPPKLGPRDSQRAIQEIWLRPADLSAALTAIESDAMLSSKIKPETAAVVGFFLGGTSALALMGGRLDAQSYRQSCEKPGLGVDCAWFAKNGVDLKKTDATQLTRSHQDRRIKVAVAVDPELSKIFDPESLVDIRARVAIINLGQSGNLAPALDASDLGRIIPRASYDTVPDAVAFSAFSACTPAGPALLREEGEDDLICRDGSGRSREEIHSEIAGRIEAVLEQSLSAEP